MKLRLLLQAFICTFALAISSAPLHAQGPAEVTAGESLPPQVTRVDGVLVPVASEVFKTLDQFANSNWRAVQRPELARWRPHGNQASLALLLGAVIAEGFIAVEAKDAAEVQSLGRAVLTLTRGLGVERWALRRSRSIDDAAQSGDWQAVRKEWDHVLPDVQEGMKELQSQQLAHLVSLGGWVRGTEALAALVLQNPSPERAALLRQPALVTHFDTQLHALGPEIRDAPAVSTAAERVRKVRVALEKSGAEALEPPVQEIGAIAAEFLQSLNSETKRS